MKKWCITAMTISIFLVLIGFSSAHAVNLSFETVTSELMIGGSFDVGLVISGNELSGNYFSGGNDLGAFDIQINYDESLIDYDSYSLNGNLGFSLDASLGDLGGGEIQLSEISLEPDLSFQPDSFTLATLSFTAIASGSGQISYLDSAITLGDYLGNPYNLDSSVPLSLNINEPSAAPVPEPATVFLFGIGLFGFASISIRKKLNN